MDALKGILCGFTQAEILKMENLFEQVGEISWDQEFCQKIAASFNCSISRDGKPAISWEQVQSWFQNRQKQLPASDTSIPVVSKELALLSEFPISSIAPESSTVNKGINVMDLSDLRFEAKSSKDYAWYDVASFLTYRVLSSGELEVRVRFAGFGSEEDEWVNVNKGVRERSIPLEPSECYFVKVGDLVLCFQERLDQAVYCDAHVVEIERRLHDIRGCRCIFVVRYDHDQTEEKVLLKRICRRPI
ncbi:protein SAWADEE HOMEODOMAIN HOMOLOG 1 isoform X2 [Malania oleifera]|uniref:protein SAWADEE HOMEODOMAIN HOMOLOG 1 isoform X2 n=1 Tax=Malania oleifera TaxID=397392 RepID=UPI0025AE4F3F|nr:protein SAWADEE HOMEODOMAIN HOMOLOG 1 isoform X2 [Malania oleifera]